LEWASRHLHATDGTEVDLTTAEFDLLTAFLRSPNRVLTRNFLLDQLHGVDWIGYDRGIDGLVSRLRRKFKQPGETVALIKTVRGAGYMFTATVKHH
jgi:DNA-binding response OmpR family regulator|tara:strand:+ start:114 stop:404 length:291 start_codon:yes stop_codon:yes gene_type:complete